MKRKAKTPLRKVLDALWKALRDTQFAKYGNTCYTCGKRGLEGSNRHLGHFIPKSICSGEMKYAPDNLRPQCYHCNINLSGNWPAYEEHLRKDGIDVDALKMRNRDTKGKKYDLHYYSTLLNNITNATPSV